MFPKRDISLASSLACANGLRVDQQVGRSAGA
jgi:hypothetical protein